MTKPKTTDETIETTAKTVTKKPAAKKVAKATEEKAETVKTPVKRVTKKAVEATEETVEKTTAEKKPAAKKVAKATEKSVEKSTSPEYIEAQATNTETAKDTDASETTPSGKPTFKDFNLKPGLQQAIDKLGYTTPTQIQAEVWNAAMEGTNIVGQSQTGTGKTTAFLLPILQAIDNKNRFPQVLIVAPTRELVQQIREDIMKLTEFYPMRSLCVIGGRKLMFQKEDLKYGPQFLVATPGRLIEFIQKRLIDTSKISHFILDEVDRMLDMGFIEDVDRIWEQLNNLKQTMTFSATINTEIKDIINKHCDNFIHIRVGEKITVDKINHTYIDIAHQHKFSTLLHVLDQHKNQKTIIFSQTKRNTEVLTRALKEAKHTCAYLNGDLDQRERNRALRAFKEGVCKILITTDVAARGLNMDNVELVVNFDVPREPESYIHRIGRTGRAGAEGKAIMFVDRDEQHLIMDIERTQKIKLKKSAEFNGIEDKNMDYIDVNLDRPLPPSEKKRRMVARSIARERGEFGGRSQGGYGRSNDRSRGGYDRGGRSNDRGNSYGGGRSNDRGGYGRSSDRNYGNNDRGGDNFGRSSYGRSNDRNESRGNFSDRSERAPRSTGTYGSFEKRTPRSDSTRSFGQSSFNKERSGDTYRSSSRGTQRTIGGYDPVEVTQTNINASRAPRPPRDFSFNERSNDRGGYGRSSDRRSDDRTGGFDRNRGSQSGGGRSNDRGGNDRFGNRSFDRTRKSR